MSERARPHPPHGTPSHRRGSAYHGGMRRTVLGFLGAAVALLAHASCGKAFTTASEEPAACATASDCEPHPCATVSCEANVCVAAAVPDGPLPEHEQTRGDCQQVACQGGQVAA